MTQHKNQIQLGAGMYPFALDQLDYFEFAGYAIENVFGQLTDLQKCEIIDLWQRNHSLPEGANSQERVAQVCYQMTDLESRRVIGVNTLYPGKLQLLKPEAKIHPVWLNRMFIDPGFRNSRLMITATAMTLCLAKTRLSASGQAGVVNANENPKLQTPALHKIFSRLGYRFLTKQAQADIWFFDFSQWEFADRRP